MTPRMERRKQNFLEKTLLVTLAKDKYLLSEFYRGCQTGLRAK